MHEPPSPVHVAPCIHRSPLPSHVVPVPLQILPPPLHVAPFTHVELEFLQISPLPLHSFLFTTSVLHFPNISLLVAALMKSASFIVYAIFSDNASDGKNAACVFTVFPLGIFLKSNVPFTEGSRENPFLKDCSSIS
jgi:hypothetical protein